MANRDHEAFAQLFTQYYRPLYRFAAHYLRDEEVARDIVHDLFLWLYENTGTIIVRTSLKSYLFACIRNRCINFLRSVKVRDAYNRGMFEAHLASGTVEFIESADLTEQAAAVIDSLPEGCLSVFRLRVFEGYKFSEIARELSISENNAKVQMHNAVRILRQRFKVSE